MLTVKQYALIKLAEELAEASQCALKQAQFGTNEVEPGQEFRNNERLQMELLDVDIWRGVLANADELPPPDPVGCTFYVREKHEKIKKYFKLAQHLYKVCPGELPL